MGKNPDTWFLRGEIQNTLKVEATPNSGLLKDLRKVIGGKTCAEGGGTKLIEMGGQLIGQGLSKPVSFRGTRGCSFDDPNCWVDPEEHCSDSRVIYEVRCLNCQGEKTAKYIGTSGFTSHKRTREHQNDVRHKRQHNSLY